METDDGRDEARADADDFAPFAPGEPEGRPTAAPPGPARRVRFGASAFRLYRRHRRAAWERLGFAVTLSLSAALLAAFGAAVMRVPHPVGTGLQFGGWALVLGLGIAFLLVAKSQAVRAYRAS